MRLPSQDNRKIIIVAPVSWSFRGKGSSLFIETEFFVVKLNVCDGIAMS